jgi:dihydrofolate synthase/folylpolyglutamate synthase
MTYPETVQFLYALGNEIKTAKLGLGRIRTLLEALGNPQRAYRIVHVAGTNGKGSTCAMVAAGLNAAGIETGLFTSPHLQEPTERIQIGGIPVTRAEFEGAFNVVHETAERLDLDCHPTYFETVTAMAFWLFRERRVPAAVIEVGLGGRLDATNVVEPALTIITPVDFDHEALLGHTIEAIAAEKAGILKPGVPLILSRQRPEAAAVIEARAAKLGVPVTHSSEFAIRDLTMDARGSDFSGIHCPLPGEHQVDNAATAALALRTLRVPPEGIASTRWPGRLEHAAPNPDIILDGAHNPSGARALARYLERFYAGRTVWMIYGAMRDKAIEEVSGVLFPLATHLIFTAPQSQRALRPEAMRDMAGRGRAEPAIAPALAYAQSHAAAEDVIVVTGSLYLVGEARARLSQHSPQWPQMVF